MQIRQVVVTGRNQVELETVEMDAALQPDELLVRTEWTFISTGTELANYTGKEPFAFVPGSWCAYPWKSGYGNVGTVEAVGSAVSRFQPGDRVFSTAPHASCVKVHQAHLVMLVPPDLDPCTAAATRMAGVGVSALIMADLRLHPWVAVFGLGLVGNLAAQAFRIMGGRVIGVDPNASRRRLAETCGIAHTVGGSPEDAQQAIADLTGTGGMVDIAVEATGLTPVVLQAMGATANLGQVLLLGTPRGPCPGDLTPVFLDIHLRNLTVRGALEWCPPTYPVVSSQGKPTFPIMSLYEKQMMIFNWVQSGQMRIEPLISHRLPPTTIRQAYDGLLREPETYIGVALDWRAHAGQD
ncbi:MAG: zinc-binding alcohol dehydrogenase [Verrucomicrobia bacterium]|nr:zinc-binding alcohol dehydrogenase [Verrucomicrobiota bacterium]MBU4285691.1 zinc-binding alcohol dehydrogenase [Verrucomicrobiota bacterium]MBU4366401.1 zinc-binding alcohol dehydrogenase [Verrucomicrobiota bacterium]